MSLRRCKKCGKLMISKHDDRDKFGRRVQWYRCVNNHWISELIDDERK
jgi:hypothetical protein